MTPQPFSQNLFSSMGAGLTRADLDSCEHRENVLQAPKRKSIKEVLKETVMNRLKETRTQRIQSKRKQKMLLQGVAPVYEDFAKPADKIEKLSKQSQVSFYTAKSHLEAQQQSKSLLTSNDPQIIEE